MDKIETTVAPKASGRNYGIDLLRLISMLMVVTLHVLGQGGVLKNVAGLTLQGEAFWALEITCYGAVNIYAIISGYVGNRARHKYSNLISLCLQLTFYAIIITTAEIIIAQINSIPITFETIFWHLLPSAKGYWYFSAYFCLFFFMPLLNEVVNRVSRRKLQVAGILVFMVFCFWTQYNDYISALKAGYSVFWLAILYVLGAYIAKYDPLKKMSALKCFIGYFLCIAITVLSRICIGEWLSNILGVNFFVSYTSPTILLSAFFLVCGCSKLQVGKKASKVISFLAPMSFGVYLIHCHQYTYGKLYGVFAWLTKEPILLGILYAIGFALLIFFACLFLDWLRLLIFKAVRMRKFAEWIEKSVTKITKGILKIFRITLDEEKDKD